MLLQRFGWLHRQSGGWGLISTHLCPQIRRLKRIQTPQGLLTVILGFQSRQNSYNPLVRIQVWVQVWALAGHLAITPESYSRRQSKVLTAKSMAKLFGPCSGTAWAGRTGKHKHRAFPSLLSRCGPRPACLRKTYYHSCDTDSVRGSKRF